MKQSISKPFEKIPIFAFLIICIVLVVFFAVYGTTSFSAHGSVFNNEKPSSFSTPWTTQDGNIWVSKLPQPVYTSTLSISNIIPEKCVPGTIIYIESNTMDISAKLDNVEIFHTPKAIRPFGNKFGIMDTIIEIPSGSSSADINLIFNLTEKQIGGSIRSIKIGTKSSIIFEKMKSQVFPTICFVGLAGVGCIFIIISFLTSLMSSFKLHMNLAYLGLFAILCSTMLIEEVSFFRFLIPNKIPLFFITTFSFMLCPVPILQFFKDIFSNVKNFLNLLSIFFIINFCASLVLFVSNYAEVETLLISTHILMTITVVFLISMIISEIRMHNTNLIHILIGSSILIVCAFIDVIRYYVLIGYAKTVVDSVRFTIIGLLAFITMFAVHSVKLLVTTTTEETQIEVYKKMAFLDILTNTPNRFAFNSELAAINIGSEKYESIGFVIFGLNNLETINLTYGQSAGDTMLFNFAACLKTVFNDKAFRNGGDEFAAVLYNPGKLDLQKALRDLRTAVLEANKNTAYTIGYSTGYALGKTKETDVYALRRQAEEYMFENKRLLAKEGKNILKK